MAVTLVRKRPASILLLGLVYSVIGSTIRAIGNTDVIYVWNSRQLKTVYFHEAMTSLRSTLFLGRSLMWALISHVDLQSLPKSLGDRGHTKFFVANNLNCKIYFVQT